MGGEVTQFSLYCSLDLYGKKNYIYIYNLRVFYNSDFGCSLKVVMYKGGPMEGVLLEMKKSKLYIYMYFNRSHPVLCYTI